MASSVDGSEVAIQEQPAANRTGGKFRGIGIKLNVPSGTPGEVTDIDTVWPIPLCIMAAEVDIAPEWLGDVFCVEIAPDTVCGVVSTTASVGDTVIGVSDTVIGALENDPESEYPGEHYHIGYRLKIGNNDYAEVVAVDAVAKTVTLSAAATVQANPGAVVLLTVKMVEAMLFTAAVPKIIGESKIGGSYLPANTIFRIKYQNNDGEAKTVGIALEALY